MKTKVEREVFPSSFFYLSPRLSWFILQPDTLTYRPAGTEASLTQQGTLPAAGGDGKTVAGWSQMV